MNTANSISRTPAREEYEAADASFRIISRAYEEARKAYRASTIGDAEFIPARRAFDAALARFDAAEAALVTEM